MGISYRSNSVAVWETIIKGMQEAPAGSAASHNRTVHYQPLSSASQNFPISRRWAVGEQTAGAVAATLCSLQLHSGGCSTGKSAAFWSCWQFFSQRGDVAEMLHHFICLWCLYRLYFHVWINSMSWAMDETGVLRRLFHLSGAKYLV